MTSLDARVREILQQLESAASPEVREQMEPRYGIVASRAFGTPMARIKEVAKPLGRDHELALALWRTGWYEARLLCSFVDDPAAVTPEQMDAWRADFDNWAVVDTLCFNLFDRTPHALAKVDRWAELKGEFDRRAAFALLACVALHRKDVADEEFVSRLPLLDAAADDDRNFVKKAVAWALRAIGGRTGTGPRRAARELAERLAASPERTRRWVGRDALRTLNRASA